MDEPHNIRLDGIISNTTQPSTYLYCMCSVSTNTSWVILTLTKKRSFSFSFILPVYNQIENRNQWTENENQPNYLDTKHLFHNLTTMIHSGATGGWEPQRERSSSPSGCNIFSLNVIRQSLTLNTVWTGFLLWRISKWRSLEVWVGMTYMVIRGTEEVAAEVGIPWQTVAFFLVTLEPQVRATLPTGIWNTQTHTDSPRRVITGVRLLLLV